ncbi:MAG: phosphotransferase family protein [Phycisphaerales bacterium]
MAGASREAREELNGNGTPASGDGLAGFSPGLANPNGHTDYSSLASMLEPALVSACDDDLSEIQWFRSTWQSGGAATAKAKFKLTDGRTADVIVKLPVGPAEYRWTTGMEGLDAPEGPHCELEYGCTPRVFAAGMELGGYDLAWLVVERLSGHPLSHQFDEESAKALLTAAVNWYERARRLRGMSEADRPAKKDWAAQLDRARQSLEDNVIASEDRWIAAVERSRRALPGLLEVWDRRPINAWCHGDLHPGNAMRRGGGSGGGECVLIDLALVHAGHWVEDAVYLERLCWPRPGILGGVRPVEYVAELLRARGALGDEDYRRLATVRRILMASTSPGYLAQDGNARYMQAALERLEESLAELGVG